MAPWRACCMRAAFARTPLAARVRHTVVHANASSEAGVSLLGMRLLDGRALDLCRA